VKRFNVEVECPNCQWRYVVYYHYTIDHYGDLWLICPGCSYETISYTDQELLHEKGRQRILNISIPED